MTAEEEAASAIKISAATRKHFELEIKTLQDSPRDADKLRELLKVKQIEYNKTEDSEGREPLVTEIEMLQYVLFLINRNSS